MKHEEKDLLQEAAPKYQTKMTPAEYLEWERNEPGRHEFADGQVIRMEGASLKHLDLQMNLYLSVGNFLKGSKCKMVPEGMRTYVAARESYFFPDASIYCEEMKFQDEHRDVAMNPNVIFEILSPSTKKYDLTRKLFFYMQLPSLREYITIDSTCMEVQMRWRNEGGVWEYDESTGADGLLLIRSIDYSLALEALYERINFEPA